MIRFRPLLRFVVLGAVIGVAGGILAVETMSRLRAAPVFVQSTGSGSMSVGDTLSGAYLAGRHAESLNDLDTAAGFMADALRRDPGNLELQRRLVLLYGTAGRIDEAVPYAGSVLAREDPMLVASLILAADAMRRGERREALARLEPLPKDGLSGYVTPPMIAWAKYDDGPDEALAAMKPFGPTAALRPVERLQAAYINDLAGRDSAARTNYLAAAEAGPRVSFRTLEALASFLDRQGERAGAADVFRSFQPDNPDSPLVDAVIERLRKPEPYPRLVRDARDGYAETLLAIGLSLFKQGETHMALIFARLALHVRPDLDMAKFFVAEILEGLKLYPEVRTLYESVDSSSPFRWEARLRAARTLAELNKFDQAVAALKAMSAERPDRYDAPFRLGNLLREKERYKEAVAAYDQAIERIKNPGPEHWAVYYARGMALERDKQYARAEKDLMRALEYRPDQPFVLNYLAYMWIDQNENLERARDMIQRAVELRPEDGYIVDSMGWFHYRMGEYDQAVTMLERAVELRPSDPVINDHLGDAYWRVGRRDEAGFQWNRAMTFDPPPELAADIKLKLDRGLTAAVNKG
ncbi:MAG: tetratricopeptide repeat protein [Alphaproteobacteria bacterium]